MSNKKAKLIGKFGEHMNESAGTEQPSDDRFEGFIPNGAATGEMTIDRIMEDADQPRKSFDEESLKGLAENIKSHGVQQPIQLRWSDEHSKWLIVYGHRRFRASKLAGMATIPCTFIGDDVSESTIRVRQLVENCQREDLAPMEMARAIKSLCGLTQWSNRRMAQELGVDHRTIGRHLELLKLPEDLQATVDRGELAASVAIDVLRIKDQTQQSDIGREIAKNRLTRSQAKQRIDQEVTRTAEERDAAPVAQKHELLTKNANITVYRHPDCPDISVKSELMALANSLSSDTTDA